jgi:hypothetical protein
MIRVLIILFFSTIYALEPSCSSCKFYIAHKTNSQLGLCDLFKEKGLNGVLIKNFAAYCRNDENLCGKSGFLYEPREEQDKKVIDITYNLNNSCCGEVNEKNEIEEYDNMEKELFDILQKIKKHNKKNIYRTSREFYKLFKKKN